MKMHLPVRMTLLIALLGASLSAAWASGEAAKHSREWLASVDIDELLHDRIEDEPPAKKEELPEVREKDSVPIQENKAEAPEPLVKIDEKMALETLKRLLAEQFGITTELKVMFDRPWETVEFEAGNWELQISGLPSQGLQSHFYLNVELWKGGTRLNSWQKGVQCELWKDAYVATQRIDRSDVLNSSMFTVQPVDVLGLYQSPVDIGTPLTDYVAASGLRTGKPLYWKDLNQRPLVQRNQIIDVVAQKGWMKITLKAKALEDGVKGQVIRVRNLQSFRDLQAEVIGVNRTRVYF